MMDIYCDPPEPSPVVAALGIDLEKEELNVLATPIIHPAYTGP
jgi:hypothetical protein